LGVSSMQLDSAARGFSFREGARLDMRMDAVNGQLTADEIVNRWSEREIADLLYREADEHDSRRIAKAIVRARPIRDTAHLATTVAGARRQWGRQRLHPATKTFLALRIAVNREMEELGQFHRYPQRQKRFCCGMQSLPSPLPSGPCHSRCQVRGIPDRSRSYDGLGDPSGIVLVRFPVEQVGDFPLRPPIHNLVGR